VAPFYLGLVDPFEDTHFLLAMCKPKAVDVGGSPTQRLARPWALSSLHAELRGFKPSVNPLSIHCFYLDGYLPAFFPQIRLEGSILDRLILGVVFHPLGSSPAGSNCLLGDLD
jgi:hypothetical protein